MIRHNKLLLSNVVKRLPPHLRDIFANNHQFCKDKFTVTQLTGGFAQYFYRYYGGTRTIAADVLDLILGTMVHEYIEKRAEKYDNVIAGKKLRHKFIWEGIEISGTPDEFILDEVGGTTGVLMDNKTATLSSMYFKYFGVKTDKPEAERLHELIIQLNFYRMALEEQGYTVREMKWFVFPKISGVRSAYGARSFHHDPMESKSLCKEHGVPALKTCPRMDDKEVKAYLLGRAKLFKHYFDSYTIPPPCKDTWDGRKCKGYCECVSCKLHPEFSQLYLDKVHKNITLDKAGKYDRKTT